MTTDNAEAAARRARAELQELAEEGCSSGEHNHHHPDECPGGNGCDNCQCDQHIASRACMVIDALRARLAAAEAAPREPVPMLLHCPECRTRHVDVGEFAAKVHHTHSCQNCGLTWRPAVVPTVGVQFLPGFKNAEPLGPTRGEQGEDLTVCGRPGCCKAAVVWRHDRVPTPADPCCWIRGLGEWVFDCRHEERMGPAGPPGEGAGALTPGTGRGGAT